MGSQKDMTRSRRRHLDHCKFMRRVEIWGEYWCGQPGRKKGGTPTRQEIREQAKEGEILHLFRTTGTPCSCSACSRTKEDRIQGKHRKRKQHWMKEIEDELAEYYEGL